ncbi:hypothetical protein A6R68_01363, partial [Neotoma lepida]
MYKNTSLQETFPKLLCSTGTKWKELNGSQSPGEWIMTMRQRPLDEGTLLIKTAGELIKEENLMSAQIKSYRRYW